MGKKRSGRALGNTSSASGVLLGIMLLPAIAAAGAAPAGGASAANAVRTPVAQSVVAPDSASRVLRSRRGDVADEAEYPTSATLDAVSQYLDQRAVRQPADPSLTESWNQFHGWADERIRKFASRFRSASVDVDDCAQETWADLITRLKNFNFDEKRGKFSSWLYTLVRNKTADLSRAANRQQARSLDAPNTDGAPASPVPSPLEALSKKVDTQKVQEAVKRLREQVSAESSKIVKLRWIDQKPIEEVKTKLNMTANQLWVREHRLRQKLRGALGSILNDGDGKN